MLCVGKIKCNSSLKTLLTLLIGLYLHSLHSQKTTSKLDSINYYLEVATENIKKNNNLNTSFIAINKVLLLSSKIDNDSLEHIATLKTGQFYSKINDTILSKYYINKSIDYFEARNNYDVLTDAYRSLGTIAYKEKNYKKAIEYTDISYTFSRKAKNPLVALPTYYNMAYWAYTIKKDMKLCAKHSLEGIKIAEKHNDSTITTFRLKGFYAFTFLQEKDPEKSWELYQPVIAYYQNQKLFRDITAIHKYFLKYYEENFNKEKLLYHVSEHRKNFTKLDESITSRSISEVREAEKFNTIAMQFQLSKNELQTTKRDKRYLIVVISIVTILLLLLIISVILIKRKNGLLNRLKTNAEKASIQKSKFIAMISHELRTPLHVVLGFTSFLIEDNPKKSQKKNLNLLNSSANHLLNLTNNVLKIYEYDYKKVKPVNKAFEFKKMISMITDSFCILIEQKNNVFQLHIDEDISRYFFGDAQKITQILTNLISNANKFTENGIITLSIKQLSIEEDLSTLYFCIEDTGIGVAKEHHESIFEAFNPNTTDLKKTSDGTGLGLSIVKNLLHVMKSNIHFESELGKGAKFSFILKLKIITTIGTVTEKLNPKKIEKLKILVVEDNKINQLLVKKILDKENAIYDLCDNGLIAVNQFKSKPKNYYDLVLMDIHMPIMNGYEASKIIRSEDQYIPIIALTATNIENEETSLKAKNLSGVIHKPFKPSALFQEIGKHLTVKAV